jgi:ABC-type thiamine transport system ATPase subunit
MTDDPPALHLDRLVIGTRAGRSLTLDGTVCAGQVVAVPARPDDGAEIARVVAGLDERRLSGSVRVQGSEVTDRQPFDRAVGYVPAGGGLLPHLTVRQNLEYGLVRRPDATADMVESRVKVAAEHLDLTLVLHARPHQASEEARLRAAIARAAVGYPAVLVIDLGDRDRGAGEDADRTAALCDVLRNASLPRARLMAVLACSMSPVVHDRADALVAPVVTGSDRA